MKEVCADCEFKPVLHICQDCGWSYTTNLANTQEHVPEAKYNNHILKKHICATYGIPYKVLPRTIICYMVMETTAKLNYFPAEAGCLKYFSPQGILRTNVKFIEGSVFHIDLLQTISIRKIGPRSWHTGCGKPAARQL